MPRASASWPRRSRSASNAGWRRRSSPRRSPRCSTSRAEVSAAQRLTGFQSKVSMIEIDHIGIAARNAQTSARALAEILGAAEPTVDGADDDMYRVDLGHGAALLFST